MNHLLTAFLMTLPFSAFAGPGTVTLLGKYSAYRISLEDAEKTFTVSKTIEVDSCNEYSLKAHLAPAKTQNQKSPAVFVLQYQVSQMTRINCPPADKPLFKEVHSTMAIGIPDNGNPEVQILIPEELNVGFDK